jgi:hypothetical protein
MNAYKRSANVRMQMAKKKPPDSASQLRAFRKAARDLGCDDNEGRFQDALRKVAKAKPKPAKSKK